MDPTARLVVGVDDSASARLALEWAVEEAQRRRLDVHVVHGWQMMFGLPGPTPEFSPPQLMELASRQGRETVAWAVQRAQELGLTATGDAVEGHPVDALLSAGAGADQIVVGDRGAGTAGRILLGSVSSGVVHHATGPVTVVRGEAGSHHHRVVVGVDLSVTSRRALARAAVEAAARAAELHVVAAWQITSADLLADFPGWAMPPLADLHAHASAGVSAAVTQTLGDRSNVRLEVIHAAAVPTLLAAAAEADLLVLGSRGLGAVERVLLGSTATACLHHSPCPVHIVPA